MLKSKNIYKIAVVITLLLSLISTNGCFFGGSSSSGKGTSGNTSTAAQTKAPFTIDYKLDDSNIGFYTQGDNIQTLLAAGPFYTGSQPLPSQGTGAYDSARTKKIADIVKESETLAQTISKVKPQMAVMRTAFLNYLTVIQQEEPKLAAFVKNTFDQITSLAIQEQLIESEYNCTAKSGSTNSLTASFLDYTKVEKSVALGGLYLQDVNNIQTYAAIALKAADNHPKAAIKTANAQLDKDLSTLDSMTLDLAALGSSIGKIDFGIKQLYTASYYFSKSANAFMTTLLPDLKAKAASLTPREGLTAENITAIKAYVSLMGNWQTQMSQRTNSFNKSELIALESPKQDWWAVFDNRVYAADLPDDYSTGVSSLTIPLKYEPPKKDDTSYLAKGWSGIKTVLQSAQTVVGVTIDSAGAVVANTSAIPLGWYYGNSLKDVIKIQTDNLKEVAANYNNGTSGSETLKTAGDYLDGAETGARGVVESGVEKATGGFGVISWGTGAITQATVGMFTGLGKGLYKLADKQSDTTRIVEGSLDVGLSLIGGSKIIMTGSKVPNLVKGVAGEIEMTGKMAVTYVESTIANAERSTLTKEMAALLAKNKLTQAEVAKLISNSIEIQAKEQMAQGLAVFRDRMTAEMTQIIKTQGANALAAAKETMKSSLNDMLKEQFTLSMQGILKATGKVVGTSTKEYLDNLVAGWADDLIKGQITAAVDAAATAAAAAPKVDTTGTVGQSKARDKTQTFGTEANPFPVALTGTVKGDPSLQYEGITYSSYAGLMGNAKVITFVYSISPNAAKTTLDFENVVIKFGNPANTSVNRQYPRTPGTPSQDTTYNWTGWIAGRWGAAPIKNAPRNKLDESWWTNGPAWTNGTPVSGKDCVAVDAGEGAPWEQAGGCEFNLKWHMEYTTIWGPPEGKEKQLAPYKNSLDALEVAVIRLIKRP